MMKMILGRSLAAEAGTASPSTSNTIPIQTPALFIPVHSTISLTKKRPPHRNGAAFSFKNRSLLRHGALFESLIIEGGDRLVDVKGVSGFHLADGLAGLKLDFNALDTRLVGESRTDSRSTPGGSGHAWNVEHDGLQVGFNRSRRSGLRTRRRR